VEIFRLLLRKLQRRPPAFYGHSLGQTVGIFLRIFLTPFTETSAKAAGEADMHIFERNLRNFPTHSTKNFA
jgi:hypothetical protein